MRDAGAMSGHIFDQVVRHGKASAGPDAVLLEVAPRNNGPYREPDQQQDGMHNSACARGQHEERDNDFDQRHEGEKPAAERQSFDGLRFQNSSEQLTDSLMANAIGIEPQRAGQQTRLRRVPTAKASRPCSQVMRTRNGISVRSKRAQSAK